MSNHARPLLTLGASRKRKERDGSDTPRTPIKTKAEPSSARAPATGNRLLAGYLAHEFLTKGTLFGKQWKPARSEPSKVANQVRPKVSAEPGPSKPPTPTAYADVSYLLKTDGVHIPGVVNPTQLARWLQM